MNDKFEKFGYLIMFMFVVMLIWVFFRHTVVKIILISAWVAIYCSILFPNDDNNQLT